MGRKPRVFVEGGVYHVYCRTAHGERAFDDPDEAAAFVEVLRETKERDGFLVYAWCLMANHYHLALRTTSPHISHTFVVRLRRCLSARRFDQGAVESCSKHVAGGAAARNVVLASRSAAAAGRV